MLLFGAPCLLPFSAVSHDAVSSDGRRKLNNGTVSLNKQETVIDAVAITHYGKRIRSYRHSLHTENPHTMHSTHTTFLKIVVKSL